MINAMQKTKQPITKEENPFTLVPTSRKMLLIKNIGRLCACGCEQPIIGPKHKKYVSKKHCDGDRYKRVGKENTNTKQIQALIAINVNYDGTRNISLYFKKGVKKEIRISRTSCIELWDTLNQISEFRNRV